MRLPGATPRWLAAFALVAGVAQVAPGTALAQEAKRDIAPPQAKPLPQPGQGKRGRNEPSGPRVGAESVVRKSGERLVEEKWQEAFKLLSKLIQATPENDPNKPELYFRLSEMHWERASDINIRAGDAEEACFQTGKPADACRAEGERIRQAGQKYRDEALKVYAHIVKTYPRYERLDAVLFALAFNYQQKGDLESAKKIYIELIKRYPQSERVPDTLLNVGEIFFDAGQVDQAERAYQKVVDSYADSSVWGYAVYKLGWCFYNQARYSDALRSFIKVVEHTNKAASQGRQGGGGLTLKKEALRDIVRTYVHIEGANPTKAIGFFRKLAPDDYLDLSERLAELYTDTGKWDESNRLLRELINIQRNSYKVIKLQRLISQNTHSMGNQVEAVKELKRLVSLWRTVKDAKDAEPKRVAEDRAGIEEQLRNMATLYHNQALKTHNATDYALAYDLYSDYVQTFPETPQAYNMTFFFAELLYKLEKWKEAATQYERALELKADGEYTKDAAHGAVLAYKKLLDIKQDKGSGSAGEGGDETAEGVPAAKPIPEDHQRYIAACDLYRKYVKESEYLVDIEYDAARIYYDYNHFDKAVPRFKNIAENHKDHRLAVFAANLLLDIYNLTGEMDAFNGQVDRFLGIYTPQRDAQFHGELVAYKQKANIKKCEGVERGKKYLDAARCYCSFADQYRQSDDRAVALYNCGLNYDRIKRVEQAIDAWLKLVNEVSGSDLVPKSLYKIAASLHGLAIFSKASEAYEHYYKNFSKTEEAKEAARISAIFRRQLGEPDKSLENSRAYLKLIGADKKKAAEVFFSMGLIYEDQQQWDKVIAHFKEYLRDYAKGAPADLALEANTRIGNAHEKKGDFKGAQSWYNSAYKGFLDLSQSDKDALTTGRNAAAEARFRMGEAIYRDFAAMELKIHPFKNVKTYVEKMTEKITAKTRLVAEASTIYNEVIVFGSANWAIAALVRIGQMYQALSEDIYNAPAPGSFDEEQQEIFKIAMNERAAVPESKAKEAYEIAIKKVQELRWWNPWVKEGEKQLAKLDPQNYRSNEEVRVQPGDFGWNWVQQPFVESLGEKEETNVAAQ